MRARVLLAALSLAAVAFAVLPTATAAPVPDAAVPGPVCVPPDGFQLWVCAGAFGPDLCVLARVGPPVHGACIDPSGPGVTVCLFDDCVTLP